MIFRRRHPGTGRPPAAASALVHTGLAGPDAVRYARALVALACAGWGAGADFDVAQLVATELVSNAVRHAGGRIDVSAAQGVGQLVLSVHDRSPAPPERGRGRGLVLVDALTTSWGCTPVAGGKLVWAVVPAPAPV